MSIGTKSVRPILVNRAKHREYLVVVRAGDRSLHPQWLSDRRNWDLAVSFYGDFPDRYRDQYDFLHIYRGSKWRGLSNFLDTHSALVRAYKYVWFPDDDIFSHCDNISNFFRICDALQLTVGQPALTPYSFHSWKVTLQNQGFIARFTNFVEIMAPCFRTDHLNFFSKYFNENSSGWGYEWLWWKLASEAAIAKFGIVDATPVFHTRPVGSSGHGGSVDSPFSEAELLMQKFNLERWQPSVLRYIKRSS